MSPTNSATTAATRRAPRPKNSQTLTHQSTTQSPLRTPISKEEITTHLCIMIRRPGATTIAGGDAAPLPLAELILFGGA